MSPRPSRLQIAKLQIKKDVEALGWLRRSVEVNPNNPPTYFVLAASSPASRGTVGQSLAS
jgi:hypothetical protein